MSDNKQPDTMRPIPDGGLKDAMPAWLKRPPAWRNMPTAEERHERTLPEPDTSVIDPHSLLDVSDLPQWLQAIAERGNLPAPEPDPVIVHGVEQLQAAATRHQQIEPPAATEPEVGVESPEPTSEHEASSEASAEVTTTTETPPTQEVATRTPASTPQESRSSWMIPLIAIALVAILAIVVLVIIL